MLVAEALQPVPTQAALVRCGEVTMLVFRPGLLSPEVIALLSGLLKFCEPIE